MDRDELEEFMQTPAHKEIMSRMPALVSLRYEHDVEYLPVSAYILPARLKPAEGESTLMGLPVVWSEEQKWGVATYLLEPKEHDNE